MELCPTMPISRAAWGVALFKLAAADEMVSLHGAMFWEGAEREQPLGLRAPVRGRFRAIATRNLAVQP